MLLDSDSQAFQGFELEIFQGGKLLNRPTYFPWYLLVLLDSDSQAFQDLCWRNSGWKTFESFDLFSI